MTSNSFFKYIVIVKTCSDIFYTIGQKTLCMLSVYLYLHFRQSFISVAVCISKYRH